MRTHAGQQNHEPRPRQVELSPPCHHSTPAGCKGQTSSVRDLIILQILVLIWGLTSILGVHIAMPVEALVVWRTGIAAAVLGLWIALRPGQRLSRRWIGVALLNGCLIGLHWQLFFLAARLGNVSVAMTGIATMALWIAFLEPLLIKERKIRAKEVVLALAVTAGVAMVAFQTAENSVPLICLLAGIGAAGVAAIFSIFNARLVKHLPPVPLTALSMTSACAFCSLLGLFYLGPPSAQWMPAPSDRLPVIILAVVCTVVAFSTYVWLQKRLSPFTIGIAGNMEPIYAMIMAALIWPEREIMTWQFYAGAAVIIGCVIAHSSRNDEARMTE